MRIRFSGLLLVITTLFCSSVKAQDSALKSYKNSKITLLDKVTRKTSITAQIGSLYSVGDFNKEGVMPLFFQSSFNKIGIGFNVNYHLEKYLSISGGVLYGALTGQIDDISPAGALNGPSDLGRGIQFKTDLLEVTLPRVDLNITRLLFKDRIDFLNPFSFGVIASYGIVFYNANIYAQNDEDVNLIYSNERGSTGSKTGSTTAFGAKFSYNMNSRIDFSLESSYRFMFSDNLDAWQAGDYNDGYLFTAFSLTYHLQERMYNYKRRHKGKINVK